MAGEGANTVLNSSALIGAYDPRGPAFTGRQSPREAVGAQIAKDSPSNVVGAINMQAQALDELHATISALENQLQLVLRPMPPTPAAVHPSAPPPEDPQIIIRIGRHEAIVHLASDRLRQLIERLQI